MKMKLQDLQEVIENLSFFSKCVLRIPKLIDLSNLRGNLHVNIFLDQIEHFLLKIGQNNFLFYDVHCTA